MQHKRTFEDEVEMGGRDVGQGHTLLHRDPKAVARSIGGKRGQSRVPNSVGRIGMRWARDAIGSIEASQSHPPSNRPVIIGPGAPLRGARCSESCPYHVPSGSLSQGPLDIPAPPVSVTCHRETKGVCMGHTSTPAHTGMRHEAVGWFLGYPLPPTHPSSISLT